MEYSKHQPTKGERILICAHWKAGQHQWLAFSRPGSDIPVPCEYTRPDGSKLVARFFAVCDRCVALAPDNPWKKVVDDAEWEDNEPIIQLPTKH
jgi:hypothetical protein